MSVTDGQTAILLGEPLQRRPEPKDGSEWKREARIHDVDKLTAFNRLEIDEHRRSKRVAGIRSEMPTPDKDGSTSERMARATGRIDSRQRDLKVNRPADRIVPVFELMRRRDQLTKEQAEAGDTYAGYWHGARGRSFGVGSYGDQRWSGTTAGQAQAGKLEREEWPIYCGQQLEAARTFIGDPSMYRVLELVVEKDASLETVGRDLMNYSSAKQCVAVGAYALKFALQRLTHLYGYQQQRPPRD